jgi:PleD family two-component response regulator
MTSSVLHHASAGVVVFVGDAARDARRLAIALARLGYAIREAASVGAITEGHPPAAIVVSAHDGVDPFRAVRAVCVRARLAHSLVFAWTPAGFAPSVGAAVAAGADDVLGEASDIDDAVDRVAGRIVRSRTLHDRATFDCVTHLRGRLFVDESLSAEIQLALAEHAATSFAVVRLGGFPATRARSGFFAAEREVELAAFALAAAVRPCDLPCRVADDTFGVLLPGARPAEAEAVLETARERMSRRAPAMRDIVLGIVEPSRGRGETWQELFARAEARLRPGVDVTSSPKASQPMRWPPDTTGS